VRFAAVLLAAVSLTGAVAGGAAGALTAAAADPIPLEGAVVTGSPITLVTADGAQVRHLDPGVYTLLIHEQSRDGFHLAGPGVNILTNPASPGDSRWTVTLATGTYYLFADPGSEFNLWSFTVGTPVVAAPVAMVMPADEDDGVIVRLPEVPTAMVTKVVGDELPLLNFRSLTVKLLSSVVAMAPPAFVEVLKLTVFVVPGL